MVGSGKEFAEVRRVAESNCGGMEEQTAVREVGQENMVALRSLG